jgi:hypothetical protein
MPKISGLTDSIALSGTELVPIVQEGTTKRTTIEDINGVLGDTLAASGGSALVGFIQSGTGAVPRTAQDKARDIVSLKDTAADFTGVADSTAAIVSSTDLLTVGGGIVYLGRGNLKYSALSVPEGVSLMGEGPFASILTCSSAVGTGIILNGANKISGVRLTATTAKTNGDLVQIVGSGCKLHDAEVENYYIGVAIRGPGSPAVAIKPEVVSVIFRNPSLTAGGCMILGEFYSNLVIHDVLGSGPLAGAQPSAGIRLLNGDTSCISDTNVTRHGAALLMDPDTGQSIYATHIVNSLFDSAVGRSSAEITPRGGNIYSTKIANTWIGLSDQCGLLMTSYGAGVADGIELTGCEFPGNTSHGLQANGANIRGLEINGGWSTGNGGNGYYFSGGIDDFQLGCFKAGNVGGRGVNAGYGVQIDAGSDGFNVHDGDVRGNTAGAIVYPLAATSGRIRDVNGFNPVGAGGIVVGASPFTHTAGAVAETVYITGGTVTAITLGGTIMLTAGPATVHLDPNESVEVTYTVVPFMNRHLH